jgi:uncharacterized protein (DUF2236 family)
MDLVGDEALEAQLAVLRAAASDARAGPFGPRSMCWRVDREAVLFLGAGRALLLQLAHPWVASAITRHSRTLADPIGRFHGTFGTVFAMVFGSVEDALAAARRLHRRHATIRGSVSETLGRFAAGTDYAANERAALRWVHATLTETAVMVYGMVLPLAADEREAFYAESRRFAGFFGLTPEELPPDWESFTAWCRATVESDTIAVGAEAREIATLLLAGAGRWIVIPPWYRALTATLLPPGLAAAYGLPAGESERRRAARAVARIRRVYPLLPRRLRFVGPYHEALERLAGRAPGPATRLSNRLWIGRGSIAAAD